MSSATRHSAGTPAGPPARPRRSATAGEPGIVVRGGTIVDESGERRGDVLLRAGRVAAVESSIEPRRGETVLDASGCIVAPGLVDLHTHLREPGGETAETVESGSRAAALGGYTAIVAMPNTEPAIDCAAVVRDVLALGEHALCEVAAAGAITVGRRGERLVPVAEMAGLGVRLFTDDGTGVQNAGLMRRALEYASGLDVVLAEHCEDAELAAGGQMHEGAWSSRLGIAGQSAVAEEAMLARDLALVRLTGAPMHFLHLSTAGSIELVRRAKADGLPVTAEVTPHHLALSDASVAGYDPLFKVNPPLRSIDDVTALRRALATGVIDAIATDHAPHPPERKDEPFDEAPPGMLGLETALAVAYSVLIAEVAEAHEAEADEAPGARAPAAGAPAVGATANGWVSATGAGKLSLVELFGLFCWRPARIAGLDRETAAGRGGHGGPIAPGAVANLTVFDPAATWVVDPACQASRSRNTPYGGLQLTGRVRHTVLGGELVVIDGAAQR